MRGGQPKLNTKILIIGAGPAGCSAGLNALKQGLDCVIVDKCKFPREKLCGGLITEEGVNEIRELGVSTNNEMFFTPEKVRFFNKDKVILEFENHNDVYVVNRSKFDNYMLNEYISRGGTFIEGEKLVLIDKQTAIFDSGMEIKFEYLIGADGAHSIVRKKINKKGVSLALCLENTTNKDRTYNGINVFFNIAQTGFCWSFENNDYIAIGIGNLYKNNFFTIKDKYESICSINNIVTDSKIRGAFVPYARPAKTFVEDNILLIGDAGGFVDPILGEGIKYALITGRYAIEAIADVEYKKAYLQKMKNICRHISVGHLLQKIFFNKIVNKLAVVILEIDKKRAIKLTNELVLKGKIKYYETLKLIHLYFSI